MVQLQESYSGNGLELEVKFLRDDFLHASEVRHGELALADADQLVHRGHIALILHQFGSNVKTANADAGQMFGLNLYGQIQYILVGIWLVLLKRVVLLLLFSIRLWVSLK